MRSRIGNALAALSLLTAAACAVLWPRSHWRGEGAFLFGGRAGTAAAASCDGAAVLCLGNADLGPERAFTLRGFSADAEEVSFALGRLAEQVPDERAWQRWGFSAGFAGPGVLGTADGRFVLLVVPFWFWLALSVPAPAAWLRRKVRTRRRLRRGQCPECGYDLRASPGQCPECGRAVG